MRLAISAILLVALSAAVPGAAQTGDPVLGRWKLNPKSRFLDRNDRLISMARAYQRDGNKVKASWQGKLASGKSVTGSYSAKCDGTPEPYGGNGQIVCHHLSRRRVDGEITDSSDPDHRYFTQQVATNGKSLNVIWYRDAERKQVREVQIFDRVEQ